MLLPLGLGVTLTIISAVGLCLNGYIALVLVQTKQITPNNILLIHLSVAQSLLSLVFLVFSFPPIIHNGIWIASIQFTCEINGFFLTILHPIALWTICGLNCDRFYAISAPLHYSAIVTNRKVITGLISGWFVIFFLSIPPFTTVAPYKFSTNMIACVPNFSTSNSLWFASVYSFVTLIIPGIVIIGCNIKVLMIARYHRHRIAAAIYEVTLSAQVTITHQRNPFFVPTVTAPSAGGPKFRSRSPISSVLQLVGSFLLIYLPYYISIMLNSILSLIYNGDGSGLANDDLNDVPNLINKTNQYIIWVAQCTLTSSTIVNAILYGLKSKIIRKTFQNYWRKKRTKNEIQQEIQARTPSTCGSRRPSVSNLGFLTRPLLQRRLSETLIDVNRGVGSNHRPKMKRIASELTWRPVSLTFAGLESPTLPRPKENVAHAASCNTLQVPTADTEMISEADRELYNSVRNSFRAAKLMDKKTINFALGSSISDSNDSSTNGNGGNRESDNRIYQPAPSSLPNANRHHANQNNNLSKHPNHQRSLSHHLPSTFGTANYLLHKVLRLDTHHDKRLNFSNLALSSSSSNSNKYKNNNSNMNKNKIGSPLKSPRILITRAFSDESESKTPSLQGSPAKEPLRQYSSTCNLAEIGSGEPWSHSNHQSNSDGQASSSDDRNYDADLDDASGTPEKKSPNAGQFIPTSELDSSEYESKRNDMTSGSNSTTFSMLSHRRYSSLDESSYYSRDYDMDSAAEEQLLLSWPTTRKKLRIYSTTGSTGGSGTGGSDGVSSAALRRKHSNRIGNFILNYSKSHKTNSHNSNCGSSTSGANSLRNGKYRPSPLFNDRCEEPEIIL